MAQINFAIVSNKMKHLADGNLDLKCLKEISKNVKIIHMMVWRECNLEQIWRVGFSLYSSHWVEGKHSPELVGVVDVETPLIVGRAGGVGVSSMKKSGGWAASLAPCGHSLTCYTALHLRRYTTLLPHNHSFIKVI